MRQEMFDGRAVLTFSDEKVEKIDNSSGPGLIIGYGKDQKIVRLEFLNPPRRSGTDQVLIVERHDPLADALDVELDEGSWHGTEENPQGFLIEFDSERRVAALEFLGASKLFSQAGLARLSHAA